MSILEGMIGWIRDAVTEKGSEPIIEWLSKRKWWGGAIGGLAALGFVTTVHVASYNAFDERIDRQKITETLEKMGYHSPRVHHLWIGGFCLRGRHPYEWQAGRVRGTACVDAWLGVAISGGYPWWPFGAPSPPSNQ